VLALLAFGLLLPRLAHAQGSDYRIGPQDLLDVRVFETSEFNGEVRVSPDGKVSLPVAGDILVSGLTDRQAADAIRLVLEKCCVNHATVTLQVKEFRYRPISVIGAVGRPGPLASSGRWTLLEVLTAAGGLAPMHGDVVYVIRHGESGLSDQLSVDVDDLLLRGDPRANIPIAPGDLINVPATVEVTVFCLGEVAHPGAVIFKSTDRMTLLTAIARAGGLSDRASNKVQIKREGAGGLVQQIDVDYKAVLAGKVADPVLKEGDVLVVKESFF
jgi:polysaccharide export outer membrane protein